MERSRTLNLRQETQEEGRQATQQLTEVRQRATALQQELQQLQQQQQDEEEASRRCDTPQRQRQDLQDRIAAQQEAARQAAQQAAEQARRRAEALQVRVQNPAIPFFARMCDQAGTFRGNRFSAQINALERQGVLLTPCNDQQGAFRQGQARRFATDPGSTQFTTTSSSSSVGSTAGLVVVIVVGIVALAGLLVLSVRLARLLKAQ